MLVATAVQIILDQSVLKFCNLQEFTRTVPSYKYIATAYVTTFCISSVIYLN